MTATPPDKLSLDPAEDPIEEARMSLGDHLQELRKRLILALVGVALVFGVTMYYGSSIILWLLTPLANAQRQAGLTPSAVTGITSGFTTFIMVSFIAAVIIALPWVLYQFWQFVSAGLYPEERKIILLLAPLSTIMATIGIVFLYYVLLPVGLFFFLSFTTSYPSAPPMQTDGLSQGIAWVNRLAVTLSGVPGSGSSNQSSQPDPVMTDTQPSQSGDNTDAAATTQPAAAVQIPMLDADPAAPLPGQIWLKQPEGEVRIFLNNQIRTLSIGTVSLVTPLIEVGDYLTFISFLGLGVVLAFQLPVVMLILGWLNLIQAALLRKYRGHALLAILVIAAFITPPDPVTLMLLGIPMYGLFELGLLFMGIANRNSRKKRLLEAEESAE
mgnify:CR=1 FL=1